MVGRYNVVGRGRGHTPRLIPLVALAALGLGCSVDASGESASDVRQTAQPWFGQGCGRTIRAHHMHATVGRPTWSGHNLWSNGDLSASHEFSGDPTTLTVRAKGSYAGGSWPIMRVSIGTDVVGTVAVASDRYEDYSFSYSGGAGRRDVTVTFTNDYFRWGKDRNLYVRSVRVDCDAPSCEDGAQNGDEEGIDCGGSCEACDTCLPATIEAESMTATTGGAVSEGWNIWTEGSLYTTHEFGGGATLEVLAKGSFADSAWPEMEVLVGEQLVGHATVNSTDYKAYAFVYAGGAGEKEVRVRFTNDYYRDGQDRNLYVDKVNVLCSGGGECPAGSEGASCEGGVCSNTGACVECLSDAQCDDGDACNGAEICGATGSCQASAAPSCDYQNECTVDSCDSSAGCQHVPADGSACSGGTCSSDGVCIQCSSSADCDDGDVCNGVETCSADGQCVTGTALSCDDGEECTADVCDPVGGCQNPLAVGQSCSIGVCGPVGACVECFADEHCDDGDGIGLCDVAGACQVLDCVPGATGPGVLSQDVVITGQNTAAGLALLAGITCLDGDLLISGTSLTDLSALDELRAVTGNVRIGAYYAPERVFGNSQLAALSGLENLRSVGGELYLRGPLQSLAALARLDQVDSLFIEETALTNLVGLESITDIPDQLITMNNSALASFEGLNNLMSVGADFDSWNNRALASVGALGNLTDVGGRLLLRLSQVPSLSGLEKLESIGDSLVIVGDGALADITALASLTEAFGVDISGASQLASLSGLSGLSSLGSVRLQDLPVVDLVGLHGLSSVDDLVLSGLPELTDLSALGGVTVMQSMEISETGLESLAGLEGLTSVETLSIYDNASLGTLTHLSGLTRVSVLDIMGNVALAQCEADDLASRLQVGCNCSGNDDAATCN